MNMRSLSCVAAAALIALTCQTSNNADGLRVVEYRNGFWFDGAVFRPATWYSAGGTLRSKRPAYVDEVVDLQRKWVVPPYAEGHNHWLEPNAIDAYAQTYLKDGVFYLKDHTNAPVIRAKLDSTLNRPGTVDFISANQGFTGPGGHPVQIARQFLAFKAFPPSWTDRDLEGNVYFAVDSAVQIDRAWSRLIESRPDFVKVFLLYSEEYARRKDDSAFLYRRGINPGFVPRIVELAHKARLRVSAHVYSATDFHNAVTAGVDDIAHMPGTGYDSTMGPAAFRISSEDAALAARRGTTVTTTLSWLAELDSSRRVALVRDVIKPNVELLKRNRVPLFVGSDQFRATPAQEADVLASLEIFTNAELLRMWSMATPTAIFPNRKLGRFADGYEASFLVLEGDPLSDFANTHRIAKRVKQGIAIVPRVVPFAPLN